jgi:hypothetical protein
VARHGSADARRSGLLEVASLQRGRKEILPISGGRTMVFDLTTDPSEQSPVDSQGAMSRGLKAWLSAVQSSLSRGDAAGADQPMGDEDLKRLKALGYID